MSQDRIRRENDVDNTRNTVTKQQLLQVKNLPFCDDDGDVRCNECAIHCTHRESWHLIMKGNTNLTYWDYLEYYSNELGCFFQQRPSVQKLLDVPFLLEFKLGDTFEIVSKCFVCTARIQQYCYKHIPCKGGNNLLVLCCMLCCVMPDVVIYSVQYRVLYM